LEVLITIRDPCYLGCEMDRYWGSQIRTSW